ncbi:Hypothetical predicted protein [Mytilus galloprovincialis]|uniref:Uncharacterized protein n=1 Tax=Mytilus galloprovincialis TaxID=29158 RepID=A0A8B6GS81_MYTGA|nr:Hypothetical predicted protein [Mytilus galloprovincialis]
MLRRQNDGNISDIPNLTNSIHDLLDNNEPDQQSIVKYIIEYPSSEETKQHSDLNDQTAVSSDILSSPTESSDEETFLLPPMTRPRKTATQPAQSTAFGPDDILSSKIQAIQTLACKSVIPTTTLSMQPSSSESIVSTDVSPTTVSISQMQSLTGKSAPRPTTLLPLVETHPISISNMSNMSNGRPSKEVSWRKTETITKCFSGALLEIVSPADLLPALADTEFRIELDKVHTTMTDSVSAMIHGTVKSFTKINGPPEDVNDNDTVYKYRILVKKLKGLAKIKKGKEVIVETSGNSALYSLNLNVGDEYVLSGCKTATDWFRSLALNIIVYKVKDLKKKPHIRDYSLGTGINTFTRTVIVVARISAHNLLTARFQIRLQPLGIATPTMLSVEKDMDLSRSQSQTAKPLCDEDRVVRQVDITMVSAVTELLTNTIYTEIQEAE